MSTAMYLPSTVLPTVGQPSHLLLGYGGGSVQGRIAYRQQIHLPRPGRCPDVPVHLIASLDSSASVVGGNDPVGQRFIEVFAAVEAVARHCKCGQELVSILHFDHPVHNDLIAAPVTDTEALQQALRTPLDGRGCSLLGSSLATGRQLALNHPNHRNVFVALTDFQLFDPTSVWDSFTTFPGEVHACILGGGFDGFDGDTRVHVTQTDRGQRPGAVAAAMFAALTAERPDRSITKPLLRPRHGRRT